MSSIIFTCTTFYDFQKENHWDTFCNGIDSIMRLHSKEEIARINKWVVINEWSEKPSRDWNVMITNKYPFIEFIQKDKKNKGQAISLNIILDLIKPHDYWIQWEESWYATSSFLSRIFNIMESTTITQLQMTSINGNVHWKEESECNEQYCIVTPSKERVARFNKTMQEIDTADINNWPHYSLRPSINRVAFYEPLGYFNTHPRLWPAKFEWEYGVRWYRKNGIKAILPDGPVERKVSHISTYH